MVHTCSLSHAIGTVGTAVHWLIAIPSTVDQEQWSDGRLVAGRVQDRTTDLHHTTVACQKVKNNIDCIHWSIEPHTIERCNGRERRYRATHNSVRAMSAHRSEQRDTSEVE